MTGMIDPDQERDPRLSRGYVPDFDIDLRIGQAGEEHVLRIFDGIGKTVEVKHDVRASETGNLYLEHAQKTRNGRWIPSGIEKTRATHWAFVLHGFRLVLVVPTGVLRHYAKNHRSVLMDRGSNPTKGYLVPVADLISYLGYLEREDRQKHGTKLYQEEE